MPGGLFCRIPLDHSLSNRSGSTLFANAPFKGREVDNLPLTSPCNWLIIMEPKTYGVPKGSNALINFNSALIAFISAAINLISAALFLPVL